MRNERGTSHSPRKVPTRAWPPSSRRPRDGRSPLAPAEQGLLEVGDDEALKPQIQLELASAAEAVGDRVRATAHSREAVDLAEAQGDEVSLAESLALVGFHAFLAGEGWPG